MGEVELEAGFTGVVARAGFVGVTIGNSTIFGGAGSGVDLATTVGSGVLCCTICIAERGSVTKIAAAAIPSIEAEVRERWFAEGFNMARNLLSKFGGRDIDNTADHARLGRPSVRATSSKCDA